MHLRSSFIAAVVTVLYATSAAAQIVGPVGPTPIDPISCHELLLCCTEIGPADASDIAPTLSSADVSVAGTDYVGIFCHILAIDADSSDIEFCRPICCVREFPLSTSSNETIGVDCIPVVLDPPGK